MTDEHKKTSPQAPKPGRRRLIKGAAAAPVLMTLASRPAWGIGGGNFCWSGIQSGNLSNQNPNTCEFGLSPGYYKNHVGPGDGPGWPLAYQNMSGCDQPYSSVPAEDKDRFKDQSLAAGSVDGLLFSDLFGVTGTRYDGYTVMQVLWRSDFAGSFGFHAIATYFNTLNFPGYAFSEPDAMGIIRDILTTGWHVAENGQEWTEDAMKCLFDAAYHNDPYHTHDKSCL